MKNQKRLIETRDWNHLIILDACRYDDFELVLESSDLEGALRKVESPVVRTSDWYNQVLHLNLKDVILLSSQAAPFSENTNYIHQEFGQSHMLWNVEDPRRVDPDETLKKALKIFEESDLKKSLIHLMPPHLPWIGEKGKKLTTKLFPTEQPGRSEKAQEYAIENDAWDEVRRYYRENILTALKAVEKYCNRMKNVVITSDHGELIGENNQYGHNQEHPKLHEIPWFEWKNET